jgi:hypothetical protein
VGSVARGQGLNRFGFVESEPVKYIDPFGLARWADAGLALLGIAGNGAGTIVGAVLLGALEPTAITKVAGGVVLGKSLSGIYLNLENLERALVDAEGAEHDLPSSLPRLIADETFPGNKDAQYIADAIELSIDLASGNIAIGIKLRPSGFLKSPQGYPPIDSSQFLPTIKTFNNSAPNDVRAYVDRMLALQGFQYSLDPLHTLVLLGSEINPCYSAR